MPKGIVGTGIPIRFFYYQMRRVGNGFATDPRVGVSLKPPHTTKQKHPNQSAILLASVDRIPWIVGELQTETFEHVWVVEFPSSIKAQREEPVE